MNDRTREEVISEIINEFSQSYAAARTRWNRYAEEVHPELRAPGMMLLQTILRRGPITATGLGSILDMDKAMVSRQITKLRGLGLVNAREAESDRRVMLLTATDAALTSIEAMRARTSDNYLTRFTEWGSDELEQLQSLLHRFNSSAEDPRGDGPAGRCAREEREELSERAERQEQDGRQEQNERN